MRLPLLQLAEILDLAAILSAGCSLPHCGFAAPGKKYLPRYEDGIELSDRARWVGWDGRGS